MSAVDLAVLGGGPAGCAAAIAGAESGLRVLLVERAAAARKTVLAGPLVALLLVPGTSLLGAAAAMGDARLAGAAALRVGVDILLITACGGAIVAWKRRFVHRRSWSFAESGRPS